jgi:hypothetical protein
MYRENINRVREKARKKLKFWKFFLVPLKLTLDVRPSHCLLTPRPVPFTVSMSLSRPLVRKRGIYK